ncbi:hypothetical protein BS78_03G218600 [Paspalum vaginatum]|nr:hypothetical protein BS78_03G218600 [Paspalum vaginatum]
MAFLSSLYVASWHHQHGRWQARIGLVAANEDLEVGDRIWSYATEQEAAETYDIAALKLKNIPVLGRRLIQNSATEAEGHAVLNGRPSQALQAHPLPGYNNSSFGFRETRLDWPYGNLEQKVQLHSKPNIVNGLLH